MLPDDDKLRAAGRFKVASRASDPAAMQALMSPDAVTWHNFDELEVTQEQSARTSAWLRRQVPDLEWKDLATLTTSEGFLIRTVLTGTAPAGPLRLHSCMIVTLDGRGLVTRIDEYLDSAQSAPLRG